MSRGWPRPLWPLLALMLAAAAPAPRSEDLQAAARAAERARAAQIEAQKAAAARAKAAAGDQARLTADRIAAAERLRDLEKLSAEAADRVVLLSKRRDDAEARLAERAAELAPFVPVIQRLSLYPAETLLAVPEPPEQAIRGLLVLGGLTRQLEAEAVQLRGEQIELADLKRSLEGATTELRQREAAQAAQAASLDAAIAAASEARQTAEGEAGVAARRAAAEAAHAETLRAALARLAAAEAEQARLAQAQAAEQRRQLEAAAHAVPAGVTTLTAPVAGSVIRSFGDEVDGVAATGMAYHVPPSARVVAPCGGRVVFGGPFRSFGLLAIIDCGSGWHAVLSGFDRLDTQVGQTLQAGEPIGAMPSWNPLQLLSRPQLQFELRHNGEPVNPAPYLRGRG